MRDFLRNRLIYFALALITMLLGLASRSSLVVLPEFLSVFAGDVLWALMVFWLFRTMQPLALILHSAILALCFTFAIEFTQLYNAPWIDVIRATKLGGLVLGFGFKPSDLLCYSVGEAIGCTLDTVFLNRCKKTRITMG